MAARAIARVIARLLGLSPRSGGRLRAAAVALAADPAGAGRRSAYYRELLDADLLVPVIGIPAGPSSRVRVEASALRMVVAARREDERGPWWLTFSDEAALAEWRPVGCSYAVVRGRDLCAHALAAGASGVFVDAASAHGSTIGPAELDVLARGIAPLGLVGCGIELPPAALSPRSVSARSGARCALLEEAVTAVVRARDVDSAYLVDVTDRSGERVPTIVVEIPARSFHAQSATLKLELAEVVGDLLDQSLPDLDITLAGPGEAVLAAARRVAEPFYTRTAEAA